MSTSRPKALTPSELEEVLKKLTEWKIVTENQIQKLSREIRFKDFKEAFTFLNKVAEISEKFDHHAEIYNTYNFVRILLYTHTKTKITDLDREVAEEIEKLI
ncbi:putative pterin-4-alpha-carbinolamine dehydratase 2 [Leptospira kobayashii]|uniref:Putative pterin-4-alpha-carbinolamine dehydratase n=1 Tax=Leptospira kobayashii TaxID=1917830 RepID=A0ABM7USB1_9LEPT|nr:4a-hydroxytetrahydrobiopterin dehydratase [Leptospira kobayashii]BDA79807.1 putative pterin-4-alpha-carbinolamine dehydratase 2 [Leptospira kobayashii]